MKHRLQVVFENGMFRPLEPVPFVDQQHLTVTVSDDEIRGTADPVRSAEQHWLREQGNHYTGEWVALDGGRLLSHGLDAKSVYTEARSAGVAIVEEATERQVNLIMMPVRYRSRLGEFNMGKTVPYVLKNAPCPVWVYREELSKVSEDKLTEEKR